MRVTITLEYDGDLASFNDFAPLSFRLQQAWDELLPAHPLRQIDVSTGTSLHSLTFDVPMDAGDQHE